MLSSDVENLIDTIKRIAPDNTALATLVTAVNDIRTSETEANVYLKAINEHMQLILETLQCINANLLLLFPPDTKKTKK